TAAGPSIVPGFSALNGGQGTANPALGASTTGMPSMAIPGMVGGALPGMNLPGISNSGNTYSGYGSPIAVSLPMPTPIPLVPIATPAPVTFAPSGADPLCPLCAPPVTSPGPVLPASTNVKFSFTVQ
ncbi:MAG: hypothetical protein ABIQ95_16010, partial [Bdellovibrionia bacterium]